ARAARQAAGLGEGHWRGVQLQSRAQRATHHAHEPLGELAGALEGDVGADRGGRDQGVPREFELTPQLAAELAQSASLTLWAGVITRGTLCSVSGRGAPQRDRARGEEECGEGWTAHGRMVF